MGICQCQTNHIITTHYVEGSRSKLIVHTENICTTQNTNYLCTNKYISSESSNYIKYHSNFSPVLNKEKNHDTLSGESSRSSDARSRPILTKLMNKSRSSSSLLVCE